MISAQPAGQTLALHSKEFVQQNVQNKTELNKKNKYIQRVKDKKGTDCEKRKLSQLVLRSSQHYVVVKTGTDL